MIINKEYKNYFEVEEVEKELRSLGIELNGANFSISGNRVVGISIKIREKGNKTLIDKLIQIGFEKKYRQMVKPNYWADPLACNCYYEVVLTKRLGIYT